MPKEKDFKRRVRARMRKTGESYTTARSRLLEKKPGFASVPASEYASVAGMSDEAVRAKTGRTWREWVEVLDAAGAARMQHRDIARHLHRDLGVTAWWSQTVTVGYERIRGLREKGQRRDGSYDVNKSRTVPVPVAELYAAFQARGRRKWLPEPGVKVRTATPPRSMRLAWSDGTPVEVHFWEKGPAKSQVQLQHRKLPTKARADELRHAWTTHLTTLTDMLHKT